MSYDEVLKAVFKDVGCVNRDGTLYIYDRKYKTNYVLLHDANTSYLFELDEKDRKLYKGCIDGTRPSDKLRLMLNFIRR